MLCAALQVQSKDCTTWAIKGLAIHPYFALLVPCRDKEVYQKYVHFADKMKKCGGEQKTANTVLEGFHKSVNGQQVLAAVMTQAVHFWHSVEQSSEPRFAQDNPRTVPIQT